jgi:pyridoxamine 5'-phosphate oxidase
MDLFKSIADIRRDYAQGSFSEAVADDNPFIQFAKWFDDATNSNLLEPTAMTLSTTGVDLRPTSRVVLLKKFDESGFVFYSNYESDKGRQIDENPQVSLLFFWDKLERQIRINGVCAKTSPEESDEYFQSRPYTSKLGAWASEQSRLLSSRFALIRRVAKLMVKYPKNVPLPPFWGGYRIKPNYFEFWQGRPSRLHDRICYRMEGEKWVKYRLNP